MNPGIGSDFASPATPWLAGDALNRLGAKSWKSIGNATCQKLEFLKVIAFSKLVQIARFINVVDLRLTQTTLTVLAGARLERRLRISGRLEFDFEKYSFHIDLEGEAPPAKRCDKGVAGVPGDQGYECKG